MAGGGELTNRHEQALLRREAGANVDRLMVTARFCTIVVAVTVLVTVAVTDWLEGLLSVYLLSRLY